MKQYRLLNIGDSLRATDEWFNIVSFEWGLIQNPIVGKKLQNITAPIRREIESFTDKDA